MTAQMRTFWIFVLIAILAINALPIALASCDDATIIQAIKASNSYSCSEYWLNRYQTLLAGLTAIGGAWMTVAAMNRQTETTRRDAASRRLSEYSAAIFKVMGKFTAVPLREAAGPADPARDQLVRALREATENPTVLEALTDPKLGPDVNMLSLFISATVGAAEYPRAGDIVGRPANLVWPLYMALTNGITERQKMLSSGTTVKSLESISTINHRKFLRAYTHGDPIEP